jgi:predicted Fe-Mo cluster-binding NifX family protein
MKIAISIKGDSLESALDAHFGRAAKFLIIDSQSRAFTVHENAQNAEAVQGAGIQAAEAVIRWGAEAVITGQTGPKAVRALKAGGVRIFLTNGLATAAEALAAWEKGALSEELGA